MDNSAQCDSQQKANRPEDDRDLQQKHCTSYKSGEARWLPLKSAVSGNLVFPFSLRPGTGDKLLWRGTPGRRWMGCNNRQLRMTGGFPYSRLGWVDNLNGGNKVPRNSLGVKI
jgi:hypothetical protein